MEQERREKRPAGDGAIDPTGVVMLLAAFGLGLVAGAVSTFLTTAESGASVRNRLRRGMEIVKKELEEVSGKAKDDWAAVGDEICDAVKRTASRVKQSAEITKGALIFRDAAARSEL